MEKIEKNNNKKKFKNITIGWLISLITLFWWWKIISKELIKNKEIKEIKEWRLEYTENWWWIDRWHATPWWARNLLKKFEQENQEKNSFDENYFIVTYSQKTKKNWINIINTEKKYLVRKWISDEEKKSIALAIFIEITRLFEEDQGVLNFISNSSYHQADLVSNLIWFNIAADNFYRKDSDTTDILTEDKVKELLKPVWIEKSLEIYEKLWTQKNTDQHPLTFVDNTYIKWDLPSEITKVQTYKKNWYYDYSNCIMFMDYDLIPESKWDFTFTWLNSQWFPLFSYKIQNKDNINSIMKKMKKTYKRFPKNFKVQIKKTNFYTWDTIEIKMYR